MYERLEKTDYSNNVCFILLVVASKALRSPLSVYFSNHVTNKFSVFNFIQVFCSVRFSIIVVFRRKSTTVVFGAFYTKQNFDIEINRSRSLLLRWRKEPCDECSPSL